jgi:hypothetical protein
VGTQADDVTADLLSQLLAPDLVEPVIGFRQWCIDHEALRSVYVRSPWPTAELAAECAAGRHDPDSVPAADCSCGIYAYYRPCPRTASVASDYINGVVVLWGRLELHVGGIRASHARVVALEAPLFGGRKRRRVDELAERLGVAVVTHRGLWSAALEQGLPVPADMRPKRSDALALNR